jgi:predicted CopG family antitoxin
MPSTTISLERSAYELLKARKKPDESFSEEVHRLLGGTRPQLSGFLDIVPVREGRAIANSIEAIRAEDLELERTQVARGKGRHGHRP